MRTSNFKISGKDPHAISIARHPPWRGPLVYKGRKYYALAPSIGLFRAWRAGQLSEAEYIERFKRETLDKLDPRQVYAELGEDAILLCHESPGKFCHRRLVADWLEKALGIEVPEVPLKA